MKKYALLTLLLLGKICCKAGVKDTLVYTQRGWNVGVAGSEMDLRFPAVSTGVGLSGLTITCPAIQIAYRIKPQIHLQAAGTFASMHLKDFVTKGTYGSDASYEADDITRSFFIETALKLLPIKPQHRIRPYLSGGLLFRQYSINVHHIIYDPSGNGTVKRNWDMVFSGLLTYLSLNPGIQIRANEHAEVFAEYNLRQLIGRPSSAWGSPNAGIESITAGLMFSLSR